MVIPWDTTGISAEDFPTAPDGTYEMEIANAEETKTKDKKYPMVIVDAKIIDSLEHNGVKIRYWVTIMPKGDSGAGISKKFIKSIGQPFEGKISIVATNWIGKKFTAGVTLEKYEGKLQNKIKYVTPYRGIEPTKEEVQDVPF